jgi:hypothetical protein
VLLLDCAENINDKREEIKISNYRNSSRNSHHHYGGAHTILWIEKLLQTPKADCRKYVIWHTLMPYLFNVKKLSESEVIDLT